jgi:glutamate 5-kinase
VERSHIQQARRVVVKIGTGVLTRGDGGLDIDALEDIARQISLAMTTAERQFIIVSSGAIAAGLSGMGFKRRPREINLLQAAAALGQSHLMYAYETAFAGSAHECAQILLTVEDIQDRRRYLNIRNTIFALWSGGAVPIVNENDSVSFDEIRFGDNDIIAAHLANMIDADLLLILTNTDGVYDKDPARYTDARVIPTVHEITDDLRAGLYGKDSALSSGGMVSKLRAAEIAVRSGIGVIVARGRGTDIALLLTGREIGTYFTPAGRRIRGRKKWIAFNPRVEGRLIIDRGGERAIVEDKKSLLPAGIREVEGDFRIGSNLSIVNVDGKEIARGLSNFSSEELRRIRGMRKAEIHDEIENRAHFDEAIHRDNMVIMS